MVCLEGAMARCSVKPSVGEFGTMAIKRLQTVHDAKRMRDRGPKAVTAVARFKREAADCAATHRVRPCKK